MQELITSLCKELRLGSYIAEFYQDIEAESHEKFLLQLLTKAVASRDLERQNRYIQQAGFDLMKRFETFDFSDVTLPSGVTPEILKASQFVENKQNLILYGRPGTGKTHLATALGIEACRKGYKTLYFKTSRLVNLLSDAKATNTESKFWKKLSQADLLILDEWGYVPFERTGTQLLFETISDCYEKRSVVITTNLPFDEWNTIFYDQKLTTAILDRLVHHGLLLMHEGQSYRIRNSKMQ